MSSLSLLCLCHQGPAQPAMMGLSSPAPPALHPVPTLLSNPPLPCLATPTGFLLSISLRSFHPRPMASFPLPGCLLWMLLWNNAFCDKTNRRLRSQVCSLGRARRDSSSPFSETTAETCHVSLKDWHPRCPTRVAHLPITRLVAWSLALGFSPQMLGLVSDERSA